MKLRVICRSYGGENMKDRPAYYTKTLCLVSLLRAVATAGVDVVFINDGPVPAERRSLMQAAGEVVELPRVGMRGSYWAALQHATSAGWDDRDVVWFGEDDYLYAPQALVELSRAGRDLEQADYFGLYGATPAMPITGDGEEPATLPARWQDLPPWTAGDHQWVRLQSTTSSFGARVGALREDLGIFRFCMVPHRTMLRDHDTCLVFQGYEPYRWSSIVRDAALLSGGTARERAREAAMAPFRLATNVRSHRRDSRRRLLIAAQPNLSTHMEASRLAPGTDWEAVAVGVGEWGRERGMLPEHRPAGTTG